MIGWKEAVNGSGILSSSVKRMMNPRSLEPLGFLPTTAFLLSRHFNVGLGRSESQRLAISLESLGCPNLTLKWILSQPNVLSLASGPRGMKFRTFGPALKAF